METERSVIVQSSAPSGRGFARHREIYRSDDTARAFLSARCSSMSSARTSLLAWSFCSRAAIRLVAMSCLGRPERRPCRSRRTPSASGRTAWVAARFPRTVWRSASSPTSAVSGWPPSPRPYSASVLSSCVPPVILTAERSLHFQLRRDRNSRGFYSGPREKKEIFSFKDPKNGIPLHQKGMLLARALT